MQRTCAETVSPDGGASKLGANLRGGRAVGYLGAPILVGLCALAWTVEHDTGHRFISFSDGVYLYAAAVGAAQGFHQLYHAVALSIPPGAVLGAGALWKLSPHVETVRLGLAASGAVTALLTYRVARVLYGLAAWPAALAAIVTLAGPLHAQFVGLDGEVFLTPIALALALALARGSIGAAVVLMGVGFFFKLTWAPFFVAGAIALIARRGRRVALSAAGSAVLLAAALYWLVLYSFGWSANDLGLQLVLAESRSGFQLGAVAGILLVLLLIWWPMLLLVRPGLDSANREARLMIAAGAASALFMLKQGTFLNVLDPLEPFVAVTAVAGAHAFWRRGSRFPRALVIGCALGATLHVASVTSGALTKSLPPPLGAAVVNTDDQGEVDAIVRTIDAHSRPDQRVLVNPFFAVLANRSEPAHAADWFILDALQRYCGDRPGSRRQCAEWSDVQRLARTGRIPVVSVDSNVTSFDAGFQHDVGVTSMLRLLIIDKPPIHTSIYARSAS